MCRLLNYCRLPICNFVLETSPNDIDAVLTCVKCVLNFNNEKIFCEDQIVLW